MAGVLASLYFNGALSNSLPVSVYGFLSHLSLALASAAVCHCMLDGSSAPPSANAFL
jgi:hypothetical protein